MSDIVPLGPLSPHHSQLCCCGCSVSSLINTLVPCQALPLPHSIHSLHITHPFPFSSHISQDYCSQSRLDGFTSSFTFDHTRTCNLLYAWRWCLINVLLLAVKHARLAGFVVCDRREWCWMAPPIFTRGLWKLQSSLFVALTHPLLDCILQYIAFCGMNVWMTPLFFCPFLFKPTWVWADCIRSQFDYIWD